MCLPGNAQLKSIFHYNSFRSYIKAYYDYHKQRNRLSMRSLAAEAGMNSSAWIHHLIRGTKNLSPRSARNLGEAMQLQGTALDYFLLLVKFEQSTVTDERDRLFQRLLDMKIEQKAVGIAEKQYEYYTRWYHPVIRSLVSKVDFGSDFALLGRCLNPPISASQARQSVRLLQRLGLIGQGENGRWQQKDSLLTTGDEVDSLNVANYHKQVARLAQGAVDRSDRDLHELAAMTVGVDKETFEKIRDRVRSFRREIIDLVDSAGETDRVYQLNVQLFPVSRIKGDKSR